MNVPGFFLGFALLAPSALGALPARDPLPPRPVRVYSRLLEPREHPDYDRRAVKPPTGRRSRTAPSSPACAGSTSRTTGSSGYAEETREVHPHVRTRATSIWPSYPILFAKNLGDLADEIKRRDLYLFDIWGYVPGSGPGGYWQQFTPPAEAFATLESKLGDRWLGTDIGEQDGRYIGGYANQMTPGSADRFEQYLNFQRHFERMGDDLGHKHATLVSLNFGHYFLKEGTYTLIGAETAQALPNNQVYYAFIRGAGKQYGVPWFGNASIFNRWGYKTYGASGRSDGDEFGPTEGHQPEPAEAAALLAHPLQLRRGRVRERVVRRRQALAHRPHPAGRATLGEGSTASPASCTRRWRCCSISTPAGRFPRHLYTDKLYRVWGNLPYDAGRLPHRRRARSALSRLPGLLLLPRRIRLPTADAYGDIADCLLSDAPLWVLERYPVVIVAGELRRRLPSCATSSSNTSSTAVTSSSRESAHLAARLLGSVRPESLSAQGDDVPGRSRLGQGPPVGAARRGSASSRRAGRRRPVRPGSTASALASTSRCPARIALRRRRPARARPGPRETRAVRGGQQRLHLITCRKGPGEYTLGVFNNTWRELPLQIRSRCGPIESLRELPLDQSEQGAVGYTARGHRRRRRLGRSTRAPPSPAATSASSP